MNDRWATAAPAACSVLSWCWLLCGWSPAACRQCWSRWLSVVRDRLVGMKQGVGRPVAQMSACWSLLCWVLGLTTSAGRWFGLLPGCGVQPYGQTRRLVTPVFVAGDLLPGRCTHKLLKYFSPTRENSSNSRSCGWCGRSGSGAVHVAWRHGEGAVAAPRRMDQGWGRFRPGHFCPPVVPNCPHGYPHDVHAPDRPEIAGGHGVAPRRGAFTQQRNRPYP